VTDQADKLYISQEACIQLGVISPTFPIIGETFKVGDPNFTTNSMTIEKSADRAKTNCECPRQQLPSKTNKGSSLIQRI